jgi:uncharacterized protein YjdB
MHNQGRTGSTIYRATFQIQGMDETTWATTFDYHCKRTEIMKWVKIAALLGSGFTVTTSKYVKRRSLTF